MKKNNSSETTNNPKAKKGFFRRFIHTILLTANLLVIALMFIAQTALHTDPNRFVFPSYLGLGFPILLLLNLLFLLWWVFRKKWLFLLIPAGAFFLCWENVTHTFPLHLQSSKETGGLKVLSYNVCLFSMVEKNSGGQMLDYIKKSDADIVCLQEFGYSTKTGYTNEEDIEKAFQEIYPYKTFRLIGTNWNSAHGLAILSKHPILSDTILLKSKDEIHAIRVEIALGNDTLCVYNCHLKSNKLTTNDKDRIREASSHIPDNATNQTVNGVSQKMSVAYKQRALQAQIIAKHLQEERHPVVVCGDFNDVPVSYAYHKIAQEGLKDAFQECGFGYGYTFNEEFFRFNIDHILHSKESRATHFHIDKIDLSDHYPIHCRLKFE